MRILIAEDDVVSRRLLELTLRKWGYDVTVTRDGREAWHVLQQPDAPQLAVLDWMMPEMDGVEVCRKILAIRTRRPNPYIYVILLTAKCQKQDVRKAMANGADDYIIKPFDRDDLQTRLRTGRRILELRSQVLWMSRSAVATSSQDPLTGLWNRMAIVDVLRQELARAHQQHRPLAVLGAALDRLDDLKKTYGDMLGNTVVREAADRIRSSLPAHMAVARYNETEFLLVAPRCPGPEAIHLAEQIRTAIAREPFDTSEGMLRVTSSLGVTVTEQGTKADVGILIGRAHDALCDANRSGGDCVVSTDAGRSDPITIQP